MKRQPFYITQSGKIARKNSTVWFMNKSVKKAIPINAIESIYCLGEVGINSKLLNLLAKEGILVHFFNYYGHYTGTFRPRESLVSGSLIVNQVEHYKDPAKRLFLARKFVHGMLKNLVRVLEHHRKHSRNVKTHMERIEALITQLTSAKTILELMNFEGQAWQEYYASYDETITKEFEFEKRSKRPPTNELNCLLSFLNSLLYTVTLSELYRTQLHPAVSYLHEPFERRFSLALDMSELFKPLIVQRALLKLVNKGEIQDKHFKRNVKGCMLTDEGKKIVLKEFDRRLKTTVEHPGLKRLVSYRRLIRLEAYKLIKHIAGDKEYTAFEMWW